MLDVLRLFANQQALWDALHRHDIRSRAPGLGAQEQLIPGFTKRYGIDRLAWFEVHESAAAALRREKQLKEWKRNWKINLIERDNPHWIDLYPTLTA
jgi:predicted GIY-YIG superfamily endonuclease